MEKQFFYAENSFRLGISALLLAILACGYFNSGKSSYEKINYIRACIEQNFNGICDDDDIPVAGLRITVTDPYNQTNVKETDENGILTLGPEDDWYLDTEMWNTDLCLYSARFNYPTDGATNLLFGRCRLPGEGSA